MTTTTSHSLNRAHRAPWRFRFWRRHWLWVAIAALSGAAIVLGFWGLSKHFTRPRSFFDLLYFVLCLFFVEGGEVSGPVPWQLQAARLLAPLATGGALFKAGAVLFREQFQSVRLFFARGHVVICGLGRKGAQLVEEFRRHGDTVVVIELDEHNDWVRNCLDMGAMVLVGDATDESMLHKARAYRARHVIAVCGADGTNVEIAMRCYELARAQSSRARDAVRCLVQVSDLNLCSHLRQHRVFTAADDPLKVAVFNTFETAARLLLRDHPLDREPIAEDDPRAVHLVLVGFGEMGQSVALQAASMAHFANGRQLVLTVIDTQATAQRKHFERRYPHFAEVCRVNYQDADAGDPAILKQIAELAADDKTIATIAVCLDDDARSFACGLNILSQLGDNETPILVRMADEGGLTRLLEDGGIPSPQMKTTRTFGSTSLTCTRPIVLNEELDRLAKAIHERYVEQQRKLGKPESDPAMQPWERLDLDFKESNRQQADHIPVKLRAIGCYSLAIGKGDPLVTKFAPEEIERMAKMEHDRWFAERRLAEWKPGPRDAAKRMSPSLVGWGRLPDDIRQFDRNAVSAIPDLLAMIGEKVYRRSDSVPQAACCVTPQTEPRP